MANIDYSSIEKVAGSMMQKQQQAPAEGNGSEFHYQPVKSDTSAGQVNISPSPSRKQRLSHFQGLYSSIQPPQNN